MNINDDVFQQVECVRTGVGAWLREDWTFIRFTGKDAAAWLQSQTTNDVLRLESGQGHAGALLDRQGRLQAHFTLHCWEDEFWMLVEKTQAPRLLEQLDAHLFIEEVTIEPAGDDLEQVALQGRRCLGFLATLLEYPAEVLPLEDHGCRPVELLGYEVLAFRESLAGEDGFVFVVERGRGQALVDALIDRGAEFGVAHIGPEAREILRIEAGIPRFGVDMDSSQPIPETTLERDHVNYDKGCYLGQEVVARLRAYGAVKQALMGLIFESDLADGKIGFSLPTFSFSKEKVGELLVVNGKKIGRITSATWSPTLNAPIALAYLDRDHRAPGTRLDLTPRNADILPVTAGRVVILPFHQPPSRADRARALYDRALEHFQKDFADEDDAAIPLLKEAVLLDPTFEDAYEVLGVILHRHHRLDEAIHYMTVLARLNPNSVMAHTNLSVFYVAKGMIPEAEEEKAKAAVLQIQKASDDRRARDMAEAERRRLEAEARERIALFREVLDIDPDDPLATFGLGRAYVQLNQHADALPHLRHATELQPDYSAAWLELGKCLEVLGQAQPALDAYRQGIRAASKKGDLMPLREMERRLKGLAEVVSNP